MDSLDSGDGGYDIILVGPNGDTDTNAEDALDSYLGTGLEICGDDSLKLTSNCPTGYGHVVRMVVEVLYVTKVTITFESPNNPAVVKEVTCFSQNNAIYVLMD